MTFWDFCAPFYDFAERTNARAYNEMLRTVRGLIPEGASVLEAAAGTGSISLAVAGKAASVLCTDVSENMLKIARRKTRGFANIAVENRSVFALGVDDAAFDAVVAGQVLHLLDEPEKAARELMRAAKSLVILPVSFTKNLRGMARFNVSLFRLLGFAPKIELDADGYRAFLEKIGFERCEHIQIAGKIPMCVAVWRRED